MVGALYIYIYYYLSVVPGVLQWRSADDWRVEIKLDNKSTVWKYYYYYYYHDIVWNGKPQSLHVPITFLPHTIPVALTTVPILRIYYYYITVLSCHRPVLPPLWLPSSPPSFFIAVTYWRGWPNGGDGWLEVELWLQRLYYSHVVDERMMRIMTERRGKWVVQYDRVGEGERTRYMYARARGRDRNSPQSMCGGYIYSKVVV